MPELIQPENNREFTTGPGDWAGDLLWHADTFLGQQGYISVDANWEDPPKTVSLQYPSVKVIPGRFNQLIFKAHMAPETYTSFHLNYKITDGFYSFEDDAYGWFDGPVWWSFDIIQTFATDWDIPNTILSLTIEITGGDPGSLAFDDFSLLPSLPKPQYLPLVGIG